MAIYNVCSPIDDDADEPPLRDSLLLHNTELSEELDPHAEGMDIDDEPNETDSVSDVHVDDHSSSSPESANDADSTPLSVSSTSDSSSPAEARTYRHSNRRGRGRARGGPSRGAGSVSRGGGGVRRGGGVRHGAGRPRRRGARVRGGRTGRSGQDANKEEWQWNTTFSNDSSMSSPLVFSAECGPSHEAQQCERPDDFLQLLFTDESVRTRGRLQTAKRKRTQRQRTTVLNAKYMCAMDCVLRNTTL